MIVQRQTATFPSIELVSGETIAPVTVAYETYGELNAQRVERDRDPARLLGRCSRRRRQQERRIPGLVGKHDWARQGLRYRQVFRLLLECVGRLQRHDRSRIDESGDRQALRTGISVCNRRRHGAFAKGSRRPFRNRKACCPSPAARWAACRRCSGLRRTRTAALRSSRSPPRTATRLSRSPSTRSAGRRSWPTRTSTAANTTRVPVRTEASP